MDDNTLELVRRICPTFDDEPTLLSGADVERITGGAVKANTLATDRCGARRFEIEYVRIGRKVRFLKDSVAEWLASSFVEPSTGRKRMAGVGNA